MFRKRRGVKNHTRVIGGVNMYKSSYLYNIEFERDYDKNYNKASLSSSSLFCCECKTVRKGFLFYFESELEC